MFKKLQTLFKLYFVTGIFILIPVFFSIMVMIFIVNKFDALLIPDMVAHFIGFRIPGLGVIAVIILALFTGAFAKNYIGRTLINLNDRLLSSVPIGGTIYLGTKQLLNAVRLKESGAFRRVVLVEYPKKDLYSLAFVTGPVKDEIQNAVKGKKLINIFVPTTPNPTSGFFLMIPEDDTVRVNLTVPAAFRLIISAGIVGPGDTGQFKLIGDRVEKVK